LIYLTQQDTLKELIMHAESGEHVEFKLLSTWREYFLARAQRRSLKIVIKSLRSARTKLLKTYCKEVREGKIGFKALCDKQGIEPFKQDAPIE
jgi:hypothetical protein